MKQKDVNTEDTFNEFFTKIKPKLDIVETISQYVYLKKDGNNYIGKCPFHNDDSLSMKVIPSKNVFKCKDCGVGGDVLNFLMRIKKSTYRDIILGLIENF